MRIKFYEEKRYMFRRNGKDCYVWFSLNDFDEITFISEVHKVSLNIYRILKTKSYLRSHRLYI